MKKAQFDIATQGVPRHYAVFRVTGLPELKRSLVSEGDLMYWNHYRHIMVKISNSMGLMISHDYLQFVSYMTASEMHETGEN